MSTEGDWMLDGVDRNFSTPVNLDENKILGVKEVRVALAAGPGMEPTILMQFQVEDKDGDDVILPLFAATAADGQLQELCTNILGFSALPLNKPVAIHECPGCGRELHGDMKYRGGCLDCYPDVTPEEEEAILHDGDPT